MSQTSEAGRAPLRGLHLSTLLTAPGDPHRSPGTPGAERWRMKGTGRGQGGGPIPPPICPGHWRPGHTPPPLSLPSAGIPGPGCSGQGRVTRSRGWLPAQAMIWGFRKSHCPSSPRQEASRDPVCVLGGHLSWSGCFSGHKPLQSGTGTKQGLAAHKLAAYAPPGAPQSWHCPPAPPLHGSSPQLPPQVVT